MARRPFRGLYAKASYFRPMKTWKNAELATPASRGRVSSTQPRHVHAQHPSRGGFVAAAGVQHHVDILFFLAGEVLG